MSVQPGPGSPLTPFGVAMNADGRDRVELSHLIGVDPVTLWRWAVGQSEPRSIVIQRAAAKVLGKTLEELGWGHGPEDNTGPASADETERQAA